jgi:hypothetical protein
MKLENFERLATGNWYVRNNTLYLEIRVKGPTTKYNVPLATYKYISEERICLNGHQN